MKFINNVITYIHTTCHMIRDHVYTYAFVKVSFSNSITQLILCDISIVFYNTQVWNHIDEGSCPGQGIGVRTRLENGLSGFILTKNLSDKPVNTPEERVNVSYAVIISVWC